jgi:hypothetical protein
LENDVSAGDLDGLLDEAAIRDLVARYAHHVDARDDTPRRDLNQAERDGQ